MRWADIDGRPSWRMATVTATSPSLLVRLDGDPVDGGAAAGGDRDGARDILGGICDVAVANSYYVGLMRSGAGGPEQIEAAAKRIVGAGADGIVCANDRLAAITTAWHEVARERGL